MSVFLARIAFSSAVWYTYLKNKERMMVMSLLDKLKNNNRIPMHMPGHKRNTALAPYLKKLAADLDITEIDGFDDLHNASGILRESMKKAADMRGAERAFYLVNGSTCGILAAVAATVKCGDKVICARNCHKSVYNALELSGAEPVFIMPDAHSQTGICKSISVDAVREKIEEHPDATLVIITSPTYEGVVSDIRGICEVCHTKKIPVLVDAAHGAHFGFGYGFPESATECGADISVESLHKTLPSLTQTAICYAGGLCDAKKIAEKLAVFETSSPSYLLMASIDGCIELLSEKQEEIFAAWEKNLDGLYKRLGKLKNLKVLKNDGQFFDLDRSKIVITAPNGAQLAQKLRSRGIECEMAAPGYVVAMTGMGDTEEMLSYFVSAVLEIDKETEKIKRTAKLCPELPERVMAPALAKGKPCEAVAYKDSIGRIAAEYLFAYPPGVPIVIAGEKITDKMAALFSEYESQGIGLSGERGQEKGKILVVRQM